jgi:hypothetical protein
MEWWFPLLIFIGTVVCFWGISYALMILAGEFQKIMDKDNDR